VTNLASKPRAGQAWLWSWAAMLALACGNVTNSPSSTPDLSDGGEGNVDAPTAGKTSGDAPSAGSLSAFGGTASGSAGVTLNIGGTSTETPSHPDFGGQGGGVQLPDVGAFSLCIYPEDIPAHWGPEVVTDDQGHQCTVGVLGNFSFKSCSYELLDVTPHDVDPFTGGHSHCCYKSRGVYCR
jgi:hypothetical protein